MGPPTPSLSDNLPDFVSGEISTDCAGGEAPAVSEKLFMKRRFGKTQRNGAFCGRGNNGFFSYIVD